jgi:hypothetical protein
MVFILWMLSVIGTSTIQVEESMVRNQVEEGFELGANPGCFIPEPITCLPYFIEWMYYEDLCLSGEPNPNPFCPNPCFMADYYRQAFFSCEIQ